MRLVCVVFAVLSFPLWAQTSHDERLAVLKFGIESEELDLVRTLRTEGNKEFQEQLRETFAAARSDDLKQQILLLFSDFKDNGLEDQALQDLDDTDKGNTVRLTLITYLTDMKSSRAADRLLGQTSGSNKVIASASIRALGRLGAVDKAEDLLKLYRDPDTDPNLKPDLVWAFGEMKASAAVDLLVQEYDDNDSQPLFQRSLLEALGKIGGDKAWTTVSSALTAANADVRSAAIGAVSGFPDKADLAAILTPALRDSQVSVRIAAAQAAFKLKNPALKDLLIYRMKKDPEPKVRTASLQAVAEYDDGPSIILALLADRKSDVSVWKDALNLALDKAFPGTSDTLRSVLEAESKDKNGTRAPLIANALLSKREAYRSLFGPQLANDKPAVRSAALRAIGLGKYTEYQDKLKTMAASDPDAGVKAQADAILKEWNKPAAEKK